MRYHRIKQLRIDSDIKQQDLADFLKLNRSTYSNYENNLRDVPVEVLAGIAEFYHTSVDYLIGRTDEKKPYPPPMTDRLRRFCRRNRHPRQKAENGPGTPSGVPGPLSSL